MVDPGRRKHLELFKIMKETRRSQAQSQLDKDRIAGIHDGMGKILAPMSRCLVTTDPRILHRDTAITVKGFLRRDYPFFQCRSRCDNLESRSRFIGITDTDIAPHLI